jgi:hypothetical protein
MMIFFFISAQLLCQLSIYRVYYTTPTPIVKEPMYAARRRQ